MASARSPPPPTPLPSSSSLNTSTTSSSAKSSSSRPASSPTPRQRRFNPDLLRPYLKRLLAAPEITGAVWDRDAEKLVKRAEEISGEVKRRMVDLEPSGYKYLCQVSVSERPRGTLSSTSSSTSSSAGPGAGKAFLSCFWDPTSDSILSEVYQNETVVVTVLAVAVRIGY
ncbi:Topoisomerase I damage affected protein 2 [Rhodotorula toruloides]|uniref:Uncharacterized protein n=1 Tax=Rhodotorula toruloides TaxID=5286 RepID=A0A2S9ZZW5_RHOTO|nr:Topoisomerase I damage affected protein 2 [Rhodotorula toruloides]PRQ71297.1 hypothetical protein AAT19DRAFT_10155 [Rhodotorula toruloides]